MRASQSDGTYACECGQLVPEGELVLIDGRQKVVRCEACAERAALAVQLQGFIDAEEEFSRGGCT